MGDQKNHERLPRRLSEDEVNAQIDAAIDRVNEEIRANGGTLPDDSDDPEEWH